MGWFRGGPNFDQLMREYDYAALTAIIIEGSKADHVERARTALTALGAGATGYVVQLLIGPGKMEDTARAQLRAVLSNDRETALLLLLEPVYTADHVKAARAVDELGRIGDSSAVPVLAAYLQLLESYVSNDPEFFDGAQSAGVLLARILQFTRVAEALHSCGSDAGVAVLLRLLRHRSDFFAGSFIARSLEAITGQKYAGEKGVDVNAWHDWWVGQGRSVDERVI